MKNAFKHCHMKFLFVGLSFVSQLLISQAESADEVLD